MIKFMFKRLRTVIYQVDDLQKAKDWYIDVTGIQPYFDEPFYAGFNINGYELGLHPGKAPSLNGTQAVAYWAVDDIEISMNKLIEKGAVITEPVSAVGEGIKVGSAKDPWGNAIGLIEER